MEAIRYDDFDYLGIFKLKPKEVEGLEKFVTPVKNENGEIDHYLSRSSIYYKEGLTYDDRKQMHTELASLLTEQSGKRAFVIAENMLNCSARVFYCEVIKQIFEGKSEKYDQAKRCFEEDCKLVRSVLRDEPSIYPYVSLPNGDEITEGRQIELDNKVLIDNFVRSFYVEDPQKSIVINPGLGGFYIGPFLNLEYGINYENISLSLYGKDKGTASAIIEKSQKGFGSFSPYENPKQALKRGDFSIFNVLTNPDTLKNPDLKEIIVIDDNLGTGNTLTILKDALERETNCDIKSMAVLTNWVNYARVNAAKSLNNDDESKILPSYKSQIEVIKKILEHNTDSEKVTRSDISAPDFKNGEYFASSMNFPDYHLTKQLIDIIKNCPEDGSEYEKLLQQYQYGKSDQTDLSIMNDIAKEVKSLYDINTNCDNKTYEETDKLLQDLIELQNKPIENNDPSQE